VIEVRGIIPILQVSSHAHSPCQRPNLVAGQGVQTVPRSSEAQGERRRSHGFGVSGSGIVTFQKAIDLLNCTEREVISVEGMSRSIRPEFKLTIPVDSDGLGSADDYEEDHDLGERELHDISCEKS